MFHPTARSPLSIHKTDRPFHIVKNSQKAIARFDLFQRGDRLLFPLPK
ncbi:hypothetical protein [Microcoleus sp. EPA2]